LRDASLRGYEYIFLVEAVNFAEPRQYVAEAYRSWLELRNELEGWQKKSIWQFIHYWWLRKTRILRERYAALRYKDEDFSD
jgi:hypothetical protein